MRCLKVCPRVERCVLSACPVNLTHGIGVKHRSRNRLRKNCLILGGPGKIEVNNSKNVMLNVIDIACERNDQPLFSGLSFTLAAGEILQIAGPNGAGKTSLLRLLAGLAKPCSGQVLWEDAPISRQREAWHAQLLWLGHRPGVKSAMTADENLQFYHPRSERGQRWQALEQVALVGYEDLAVAQLSAGQQRRVALARLWLSQAAVWILDEPFTAIDKAGTEVLTRRIEQHVEQGGAVILTTHQPLRELTVPLRTLTLGEGEFAPC